MKNSVNFWEHWELAVLIPSTCINIMWLKINWKLKRHKLFTLGKYMYSVLNPTFYSLRFSEYVHGLAFAVNLLWNWCVTDCCDQSKTTFVVIFFQRATEAPETEVAAESGNSVPAGDLWSEAAAGLLHLPTFSTKGFMN